MEDGWDDAPGHEPTAIPAEPANAEAAPDMPAPPLSEPPSIEVGATEEVILIDESEFDAELAKAEGSDEQVLAQRPATYISNEMFDAARGKPASMRPPPSVSVSFVDLEQQGRAELAKRISKSVKRDLRFTDKTPTDLIQRVASLIVNRDWLKDTQERREAVLCFLDTYEPETYVNNPDVHNAEDEQLWDTFLAQLLLANPRVADSISRKRAQTPSGAHDKRT